MDAAAALHACGGAASWRRLRDLGVTQHSVRSAVAQGAVQRLGRGAYALAAADAALVAGVRLGGILSCASAARYHGLPLLTDPGVHVTVPRGSGRSAVGGVTIHRRDLRSDERDWMVTTVLRTTLDCARELPLREAVAICDAATRAGLPRRELQEAAAAAGGNGGRALRRAVAAADPQAESPIESCLRLLAAPLGRCQLQVQIAGVGRVDMVLDGWLVLEADGFEHHSTRAHYREDRRRANALTQRGFVLLRFSYEDIVHRPEHVQETIRRVLKQRAA